MSIAVVRTPDKRVKEIKEPDYGEALVRTVTGALDSARSLSATSRAMLRSMALSALMPSAERHFIQDRVADMFHKVLSGVEAELVRTADEAVALIDSARADEELHRQRQSEAQEALEVREAEMKQAIRQCKEDNVAMQAARAALDAARQEREREDAPYHEAVALREEVMSSLERHYAPLAAGQSGRAAAGHLAALAPLMQRVAIQDSFRAAFSVAAVKPSASRSSFDTVVVDTLKAEFGKAVSRLEATIASAAAGVAAGKKKLDSVESALEVARQRQGESAASLRSAEVAQRGAEAAVGRAEEAVRAAAAVQRRREAEPAAARRRLTEFRAGPMAALEVLAAWRAQSLEATMPSPAPCSGAANPATLVMAMPARAGA